MPYSTRGVESIPIPWSTTIITKGLQSVVNSWNLDISVGSNGVIGGSVNVGWANVTANGTQSVPIGFVVEGQSGAHQCPLRLILNYFAIALTKPEVDFSTEVAERW